MNEVKELKRKLVWANDTVLVEVVEVLESELEVSLNPISAFLNMFAHA